MTYEEAIKHPKCPQWLKDAIVEWADIQISDAGHVIWKDGIWNGGIWNGGIWKDGTWERGWWERGTLEGGIWKDGIWKGGIWKGGLWKAGHRVPTCKWLVCASGDRIAIGCKEKTIPEWDEWFAGTEEFDTPRDSEAFRLIEANYLAVKAYAQHLNKENDQ